MNRNLEEEIQEIIDRETRAWNEKNVELLLSIFHPDMVWVWPTSSESHDPMSWTSFLGKFNYDRWSKVYHDWFADYELIHNLRSTQKIFVTKQGDGAFAVVDVNTLWKNDHDQSHWIGRTCKTYSKTEAGWKMISQVGVLNYNLKDVKWKAYIKHQILVFLMKY
jgi:ketosteroid isomerase-like protein